MSTDLHLLIVEDNPADVALIRHELCDGGGVDWCIEHVARARDAGSRLEAGGVDMVLLDLNLPDATGLDTLQAIRAVDRRVPIVVLTGVNDEMLALAALKHGAQDYLVKGEATGRWLSRAIRFAGERGKQQKELWELALFDELTGLYNRRGFRLMAERECESLARTESGLLIVAMDLDDLKRINDTYGHAAGDGALRAVGQALREAFRRTDIVARVGGDEFLCIVRHAAPEESQALRDRVRHVLNRLAREASLGFDISVSSGCAYRPGRSMVVLEDLLLEADRELYRAKDARRTDATR